MLWADARGVDPAVDVLDLGHELVGAQVQRRVLGQVVELAVEHAQNLLALIVHDRLILRVVQHGHRVLAARVLAPLVQVADRLQPRVVLCGTKGSRQDPSAMLAVCIHTRDASVVGKIAKPKLVGS